MLYNNDNITINFDKNYITSRLLSLITRTMYKIVIAYIKASIGNESVSKIIINNMMPLFLNCDQHFANFKP